MVSDRESRGYWRYVIAAGIGSIFCLALVADLSTVDRSYERQASDRAEYYSAQADENVRNRCLSPSSKGKPDCIEDADNTAREHQRREQELSAQLVSAWWTKITGITAIVGITLSAFGVYLVWTTFDETKKSNRIAEDVAETEQRPWVSVQEIVAERQVFPRNPDRYKGHVFHIYLGNSGITPATNVRIIVKSAVFPVPDSSLVSRISARPEFDDDARSWNIVQSWPTHVASVAIAARDIKALCNKSATVIIYGFIDYSNVSGKGGIKTTDFSLDLKDEIGASFITDVDGPNDGLFAYFPSMTGRNKMT